MRKLSALFFGLALLLAFPVGSAFADSKLDSTVHDLLGIDYRTAGTTTDGFDCSGFTAYVFKKLGVTLPHSSASQATLGTKVARDDLRPGDLVFFNTNGKGISHVGIYVGDNKFAQSSTSLGVTITDLDEKYWKPKYVTARRVLDSETYEKVAVDVE